MTRVRIKITSHGGYVVGDGECPFDPDQFLILFGNKIIEAQRQGMQELEIPDEEIDRFIAEQKLQLRDEVMAAPAVSRTYTKKGGINGLLETNG
jgi:hypothetical protein